MRPELLDEPFVPRRQQHSELRSVLSCSNLGHLKLCLLHQRLPHRYLLPSLRLLPRLCPTVLPQLLCTGLQSHLRRCCVLPFNSSALLRRRQHRSLRHKYHSQHSACPVAKGTFGDNSTRKCVLHCPLGSFADSTTQLCVASILRFMFSLSRNSSLLWKQCHQKLSFAVQRRLICR